MTPKFVLIQPDGTKLNVYSFDSPNGVPSTIQASTGTNPPATIPVGTLLGIDLDKIVGDAMQLGFDVMPR